MDEPQTTDGPQRYRWDGPRRRQEPQVTLVVGHDHTTTSGHTLAVATDLAERLRAFLHVVHVIDLDDYPVDSDSSDWDDRGEQVLGDQRRAVGTALADTRFGWSYHASRGDPADLLLAVAREESALMIVVGSRGDGWSAAFERLLDHSVSREVIRRHGRPVLVVPPSDSG